MARSDRQIVAAAFRGQLTKPVSKLTDAYVARLAREVRAARAEGRRPERQAGRGHRRRVLPSGQTISTEHPRGRVRRDGVLVPWTPDVKPTPIRGGPEDRHVVGHAVLVQRDFRQRYAAWRWARRLDPGTGVQVIAHGEQLPEYGTDDAAPEPDDGDDAEPVKTWRVIYTGNSEGMPDLNGAAIVEYGDLIDAENRVFVPGSADAWIVRWQR